MLPKWIRIKNQERLIKDLKNSQDKYSGNAEKWPENDYITTTTTTNSIDGIAFKIIDEDTVAYQLSGFNRKDSDWAIVSAKDFWRVVIEDAENFLAILRE